MSDTPRIGAAGIAALTLQSVILETLVSKKVLTKDEAVNCFKKAAELHGKAVEKVTLPYNRDAEALLLQGAKDFDAAVQDK